MINAISFEPYWADLDYLKWSSDTFKGISLPKEDAQALCEQGIPEWVAPNIYFELNEVRSNVLKLGEDRDDREIFISFNTLTILVGETEQFMNSSASTLRKALQLYALMVESAVNNNPNAVVENQIEDSLIEKFEHELYIVDPSCLRGATFWSSEINRLRSHRQDE